MHRKAHGRMSGKKSKKMHSRRVLRRELKKDTTITKLGNSTNRSNYGDGIQAGQLLAWIDMDLEEVYNLAMDRFNESDYTEYIETNS